MDREDMDREELIEWWNKVRKSMLNRAYNQAFDDLWKLATSKFDEVMDFQDLAECIKELKK